MTTLKPTANLVILAPVKQQKGSGSIELPERYKEPQQLWKVLHVGPGARKRNKKGVPHGTIIPPDVKPGDTVITQQIPNTRHVFSDGVIVMDASELIAVITNKSLYQHIQRPAQEVTNGALRMNLPQKPKYGEPCNGCGKCCAIELCHAGEMVFPGSQPPCRALKISPDGKRTYCELIAIETVFKLEPMLKECLGVGHGCSMK